MQNFVCDALVKNLVFNDDAIKELHESMLERVAVHNASAEDPESYLTPIYIVRFDNRGYKTFSAQEAWSFYSSANTIERVVLQAESRRAGERIEIRLDTDPNASSHIIVAGDSKDWVEATFAALERVVSRRKNTVTSIIRTPWMVLALQLVGILIGLLLCLWLATLTAPHIKEVEYPRALSFAFWFLVYSNLWGYLQRQALIELGQLFPVVRFSRKGDHWTQVLARKGVETAGVGIAVWMLAWLTQWAASVIAPFISIAP